MPRRGLVPITLQRLERDFSDPDAVLLAEMLALKG
jgi:hypothetical protein